MLLLVFVHREKKKANNPKRTPLKRNACEPSEARENRAHLSVSTVPPPSPTSLPDVVIIADFTQTRPSFVSLFFLFLRTGFPNPL